MIWEQICPLPAEPLEAVTFLAAHFSYPEVSHIEHCLQ